MADGREIERGVAARCGRDDSGMEGESRTSVFVGDWGELVELSTRVGPPKLGPLDLDKVLLAIGCRL
jgi:hypothetical protein